MNTDAAITLKHLQDLDGRAFARGYTVYSDFLNMDEIGSLKALKTRSAVTLYGGYENAERCVAAFGEDADFPIVCLCIAPLNAKFSDRLTHRDVLGALMHLGIERSTLGDILMRENTAYLFCLDSISAYITQELTRIKHTTVSVEVTNTLPDFITEKPEETALIVPSLRADAVIAAVYKLSRSHAAKLFHEGKIFINARPCEKESAILKSGDVLSVRGYGKFIFEGEERKTKKERTVITVRIYK